MSDTNKYNVDMMRRHSILASSSSEQKGSLTMNRRCVDIPPLNTSFNDSNQFQNPFSYEGGESDKASSHRNSTTPLTSPYSPILQNFSPGPRLPQPMSQPSPHFSLSPWSSSFRIFPAVERDGKDSILTPIPFMMRANRSRVLRQPRNDHRRSNSDIPFGIEAMIAPKPPQLINQNPLELLSGAVMRTGESSSELESLVVVEETKSDEQSIKEFLVACMNTNLDRSGSHYGMKKSTTLGVKRRAGKEIAPPLGRHHRSFSMDTKSNGKLVIGGNESHNLPPLPPSIVSPTNFVDVNQIASRLGFGNGEFTPFEINKIIADDYLIEIAQSDPKRAKRILANRQAAARSKDKKHGHTIDLEHKLQDLKAQNTSLSAQVQLLQVDKRVLIDQHKELRHLLEEAEQQSQLREALFNQLNGELQQLKLATSELSTHDISYMQSLNAEMSEKFDIDQLHQPQGNPNEQI